MPFAPGPPEDLLVVTTIQPPDRGAPARRAPAAAARPPQPPSRPPQDGDDDDDDWVATPARLAVVLVLVLLVGGAFLLAGFDDTGDPNAGIELGIIEDDDDGGTTVPDAPPLPGVDASTIAIYVGNGSGNPDQGAVVAERLRGAGFSSTLEPGGAPDTGSTLVYFLPEQEAAAEAVATTLGLGADRIVAWPQPAPFEGAPFGSMVVVQLGTDLAG